MNNFDFLKEIETCEHYLNSANTHLQKVSNTESVQTVISENLKSLTILKQGVSNV